MLEVGRETLQAGHFDLCAERRYVAVPWMRRQELKAREAWSAICDSRPPGTGWRRLPDYPLCAAGSWRREAALIYIEEARATRERPERPRLSLMTTPPDLRET